LIVAVRHGPVVNPENIVYARLPGYHLSEQGRGDAGRLAAELSGIAVAAVYSSPLDRAVETATILPEPQGLPVVPEDRLLEWSFWEHRHLVGSGLGVAAFHTMNLPHLATVRLRPSPPDVVDLVRWAQTA
jgi:broad specificity phosphatase PhoE